MGSKQIARLFAFGVEAMLEDAEYQSSDTQYKIAEIIARYKSKISDVDVDNLLKYGGYKIIKTIMLRRPDLSYEELYRLIDIVNAP